MQSLVAKKIPLEPAQADQLKTLFASAGFGILREVIAAHCAVAQVDYMNSSLYETDNAENKALIAKLKAIEFNHALDVLDRLGQLEQEWFRINLEQR